MSYEYARVPFKPGVNIIAGPNGAGKSSLLLAISVGLGQSYTERSRKLSDLIRWGKDKARVTLVLDNGKRGNKRPIRRYNKDQLFLTRVLRKDGKYWFEFENHAATRQKVEKILGKFGVDPNNMLIIMHQNMVEQFSVLSNIEKLHMVEAAVGLAAFRENVVKAQSKLTGILGQEESVSKLLDSAEQTLSYWRDQYAKYQEKKQLQMNRKFLGRELAWAEVNRRESALKALQMDRQKEQENLNCIKEETESVKGQLMDYQNKYETLKEAMKLILDERFNLERGIAEYEVTISIVQDLLIETAAFEPKVQKNASQFKLFKRENLREIMANSRENLAKINEKVVESKTKMQSVDETTEKVSNYVSDKKIELALLQYRREKVRDCLEKIDTMIHCARVSLDEAIFKAEQTGPRIAVIKSLAEIVDEMRVTEGHLVALADVSKDIESMYESYSKLYLELKNKAQVVAENREKTLEEVKTRLQAWQSVVRSLLERVNLEYQKIMHQNSATGEVRLGNGHDIESAALEVLVGFKGGRPVALDAYTQSGGERTTATMSFLLALQRYVRSPFRAVDEYDIHMDPKNRETIAHILLSMIANSMGQYVVITPSQITFAQKDVNIVTVQNVEGKSIIREII